jgi:hypothetical protein
VVAELCRFIANRPFPSHQGPGRRSDSLESQCQQQLSLFETRLAQLVTLNEKLKMHIENATRMKDGVSSVQSDLVESNTSGLNNN